MAVFDTWLSEKLNSLSIDEEVYSDYLKSVLDEEDAETQQESLTEILSGVIEVGATEVADEIIQAWRKQDANAEPAAEEAPLELNANLKALIEQQGQQENTKTIHKKKDGDEYLRQKLLAQYGEVSDEEDEDDGSSDEESAPSEFVNVNAQAVAEKGAAEREKAKKAAAEKKILDKANLQKDKAKKDERKEKEKARTQKGERRGGR